MRLDVMSTGGRLREVQDLARDVHAAGLDGVVLTEAGRTAYLSCAAVALAADVDVLTGIAVAFPRSPMVTAQIAWDLQAASDGRFILGLGTQVKGHNERRFSVKFESPGPKMREAVLAMRAIWDTWQNGTKLNFKGQFYRFDLMTPFFAPEPIAHPKIPVYIAGVNQLMCRIAGEVCDGLHVHPFNSSKYLREYVQPAVDEGLAKSGRARADFTYVTMTFVVVADTEEEARRQKQAVKQQIAFYASTRTYEPVLATHGWQDLVPHLHRKSVEGDWAGMANLITDEMLETYAVVGTYDTIARKIQERYAGLLDRTAFYQPYQPTLDDPRLPRVVREFNG